MPSLEAALVASLLAQPNLTDHVGQRIRPLAAAQSDPLPYLTYSVGHGQSFATLGDGPADYRPASVELGVYAASALGVAEIAQALRTALDGHGETRSGVEFDLELEDETDTQEGMIPGTERPAHVRVLTFAVLYRLV